MEPRVFRGHAFRFGLGGRRVEEVAEEDVSLNGEMEGLALHL